MKTATYTNKATGETHTISGVRNIGHAWDLSNTVCNRKGWNPETFAIDVIVKVK